MNIKKWLQNRLLVATIGFLTGAAVSMMIQSILGTSFSASVEYLAPPFIGGLYTAALSEIIRFAVFLEAEIKQFESKVSAKRSNIRSIVPSEEVVGSVPEKMRSVKDSLDNIDKTLGEINKYSESVKDLNLNKEEELWSYLVGRGVEDVHEHLNYLKQGRRFVQKEKIGEVWQEIVGGATNFVIATNIVRIRDWSGVKDETETIDAQREALENEEHPVSILRININNWKSVSEDVVREQHSWLHTHKEEAGIDIGSLDYKHVKEKCKWRSARAKLDLENMDATPDIVIADNDIALVSQVDDYGELEKSTLTINDKDLVELRAFIKRVLYSLDRSGDFKSSNDHEVERYVSAIKD